MAIENSMTTEQAKRVYKILVDLAGAPDSEVWCGVFVSQMTRIDQQFNTEYRFQGTLGFGGKYYPRKNKIDCYQEDYTMDRLETIEKVNKALACILEG